MTEEQKDRMRDEAIAKWWEEWWAADYSWEGLKEHDWHGWLVVEDKVVYDTYIKKKGLPSGCPNTACKVIPKIDLEKLTNATNTWPASLQDYWRDQESSLVTEPNSNRKWAVPFIPPEWRNGNKSWKSSQNGYSDNWGKLDNIIIDRVNHGKYTNVAHLINWPEKIDGQDKRAQLRGTCIATCPAFPPNPSQEGENLFKENLRNQVKAPLHITARQTVFLQTQDFNLSIFGSATNFIKAQFSGNATLFISAIFSGGGCFFPRGTIFKWLF